MKTLNTALALFSLRTAAFPAVLNEVLESHQLDERQTTPAQAVSAARTNCGPTPCLVFSATEQYVSTTGDHAYQSPAANQIRGPCPGLNAAANHNYLPRNGVPTIAQTITGLGALYGMSADLAGFLAAYAVIFQGDPLTQTWSIGGPPGSALGTGILGPAPGISYSHNNYEGDSSIARNDAFINNGDAHSLNTSRFASAYAVGQPKDRYTLDLFAKNFASKADQSVRENPYYFAAPFSTTLVSPAAYNFVINFMSNHSAAEPSGYLNGDMFKTFFAVSQDAKGNFVWNRGQERIPDNWYRRPSSTQYTAVSVLQDLATQFAAYPSSFRLGGNTNGVNTYKGLDVESLTNGAYSSGNLTNPANYKASACFYEQFVQVILPDSATIGGTLEAAVGNLVNKYVKGLAGQSSCPVITNYNKKALAAYPGSGYNPQGPAQNY